MDTYSRSAAQSPHVGTIKALVKMKIWNPGQQLDWKYRDIVVGYAVSYEQLEMQQTLTHAIPLSSPLAPAPPLTPATHTPICLFVSLLNV